MYDSAKNDQASLDFQPHRQLPKASLPYVAYNSNMGLPTKNPQKNAKD